MRATRKLYWFLVAQCGIDLLRAQRSIKHTWKFLSALRQFRAAYHGPISILPCLQDWGDSGGHTRNEYFWQDLYVARKIFLANPSKHVDIGSRVDGFVGHLATFRTVEVIDIRAPDCEVPNVQFHQADFMNPRPDLIQYTDSISSLHALEHFGLGRYGDSIDVDGHERGLTNIAKMLSPGGILYLSVPVGRERVEFNAHRVLSARKLTLYTQQLGFSIEELAWIDGNNKVVRSSSVEHDLLTLDLQEYTLAIFTFRNTRTA